MLFRGAQGQNEGVQAGGELRLQSGMDHPVSRDPSPPGKRF